MKKMWIVWMLALILCMTGCQSAEDKRREEVVQAFEEIGVAHNEVIMSVLSKTWNVIDGEDVYTFTKEGTGTHNEDAFAYSCDFDDDNNIAMKITMDESGEELLYYVSSDDTGHGLYVESAIEGTVMHLIPENVQLLGAEDERVQKMIGEWADKSDNRYVFHEDLTMMIKGDEGEKDTEGTFSIVVIDGTEIVTLVFGSNTLEFVYQFSADGNAVELCAPGTDTIHLWTRK